MVEAEPPHPRAAAVPPRPPGVTILAVAFAFFALLTLLSALGGFLLEPRTGATVGLAGLFAVLGLVEAATAYGLWHAQRWAWYAAVVIEALSVLTGITNLLGGAVLSGVVSLLVAAIVIWYLFRPDVQGWFGLAFRTPWRGGRPA